MIKNLLQGEPRLRFHRNKKEETIQQLLPQQATEPTWCIFLPPISLFVFCYRFSFSCYFYFFPIFHFPFPNHAPLIPFSFYYLIMNLFLLRTMWSMLWPRSNHCLSQSILYWLLIILLLRSYIATQQITKNNQRKLDLFICFHSNVYKAANLGKQ